MLRKNYVNDFRNASLLIRLAPSLEPTNVNDELIAAFTALGDRPSPLL
jgi:hypothetical protein